MNRLRDEAGDDPVAVKGIELLRGTPPAARMPDAKRRVWMSLQRAQQTRRGFAFRLPKLRMAAVVIGVVCVAGSAGAVIAARRWIAPIFAPIFAPILRAEPSATSASVQGRKASTGRTLAMRHAPATTAAPTSPVAPAPVATPPARPQAVAAVSAPVLGATSAVRGTARKGAISRRVSISAAAPSEAMPAAETIRTLPASAAVTARERTEVLDAMVALRRDHDPVSAGTMLDRYLTAHPTGALREEALVLAIEAAGGRGDGSSARSLARQYQAAYPSGRFRHYAQTAARP